MNRVIPPLCLLAGLCLALTPMPGRAQTPELVVQTGHAGPVTSVSFSPDGRLLASGSGDSTVKLWDTTSGLLLRTLPGKDAISSVTFSPDGRLVGGAGASGRISLWDVATGNPLRNDPSFKMNALCSAFSLNGQVLVLGGMRADFRFSSGDRHLSLWDGATGKFVKALVGAPAEIRSVAFSPDGTLLAVGGSDISKGRSALALWDVATATRRKTLINAHVNTGEMDAVAFSPDGRVLASGYSGVGVQLWDAASGKLIHAYPEAKNSQSEISSLAFTRDGRCLVVAHSGGRGPARERGGCRLETINLRTNKTILTIRGLGYIHAVAVSPDGRTLATAMGDGSIILRQTSGTVRRLKPDDIDVNEVALGPEGKTLEFQTAKRTDTGYSTWTVMVWDLLDPSHHGLLSKYPVEVQDHIIAAVNPEKHLAASYGVDDGPDLDNVGPYVVIKDSMTGQTIRKIRGEFADMSSMALSNDGRLLAIGIGHDISLYSVASGRLTATLTGHTGAVAGVAFGPHDGYLVSGSDDGTVRFWGVRAAGLLATLYLLGPDGWAVVTPDGRFDTDDIDSVSLLHWVLPDAPFTPVPLEAFMRQYYEPRLLSRILAGEALPPIPSIATLNRVQPTARVTAVKAHPQDPAVVDVTVQAKGETGAFHQDGQTVAKRSGVYDLRLFRNGQLVGYLPQGDEGELPVDLTDGTNGTVTHTFTVRLPRDGRRHAEFSAYAFNGDQVKSRTDRVTYTPPQPLAPVKDRAYVVSLGVNAYQDPHWDLKAAAPDARLLLDRLPRGLRKAHEYADVVPIPLLSEAGASPGAVRATRADLHAVLDALAGAATPADTALLKTIPQASRVHKAAPEDLVLLSFACHGDADARGNFYLFPADIGPSQERGLTDDLKAHAISSQDLSRWLRDVDAGTVTMIVDACHSAATVNVPGFKPGPMGSRGLGQLAYDKGMQILAASQADNVALESDLLGGGHGLLTWALVHDGLDARQAATGPRSSTVTLSRWLQYGVTRVPSLYLEVKNHRVQSFGRDVPRATEAVETAAEQAQDAAPPLAQQPALFDFNRQKRDVVIESSVRAAPPL